MKKAVFSMNIGDYYPKMTKHSFARMKNYCKKIGADFIVINERKFPDFPINYEKLQIYELGKEYDYIMYLDADCFIAENMPDFTNLPDKLKNAILIPFLHGLFGL